MPTAAASELSTYSLRRWLPTLADCLHLDDGLAQAIGDWQDIPKGAGQRCARATHLMSRRYADGSATTGGEAKLLVLVGLSLVAKQVGKRDVSFEDIRSANVRLDSLQDMSVANWGANAVSHAAAPPPPPSQVDVSSVCVAQVRRKQH